MNLPVNTAPVALLREVLDIIKATYPVEFVDGLATEDRRQASGADVVDALCALEQRIEAVAGSDAAMVAAFTPRGRYDDWDDAFERTIVQEPGTERRFVSCVEHRTPWTVGQIEEDGATARVMDSKHGHREGALLSGQPSLFISTPSGGDYFLTWQEAYNLGAALIDSALVAHYG